MTGEATEPRLAVTLASAAGLAAVIVLVVALTAGAGPFRALGWSDPGLLVRLAEPLVRLAADAAAVVCVGSLVFAVGFTVREDDGALSPRAWAAVRTAGRWAGVWAVTAVAESVLVLAGISGGLDSVRRLLGAGSSPSAIVTAVSAGETPLAWLLTAVLAVGVATVCRLALRQTTALAALAVAVAGLLPPAATGHASSQTGHDLAVPALWIHVVAAVVWLGALVAVLRPGWRRGRGVAPVEATAARYARLAGVCWVLVVASGLVDAVVLVATPEALFSSYGVLVLAVVVTTAGCGELGRRGRRRSLEREEWGRLAIRELVLLTVTAGLSVAATALVPPAWQQPVTAQQTLLGYDLTGPPTALRLAVDWRVDVVFASAAVLGAVLYLRGVARVRSGGEVWPVGRTAAWLAGCAVLLVATSSGIGRYASGMFSVHMASHMLLAVLAPVLVVLGAPVTLVRRSTRDPGGGLAGPVDWVATLAASAPGRFVLRPLPATALFVAAPLVIYLTPVFDAASRFRWAGQLLDLTSLGVGLLFAHVTVGLAARRPMWSRLGLVLLAMPGGAVLAVVLANVRTVVGDGPAGDNMYSSLALPWTAGDLLGDQHVAAAVTLILGEVFLLLPIAVLLRRWDRDRDRDPGGEDLLVAARAGR